MNEPNNTLQVNVDEGRSTTLDFYQVKKASLILRALDHPLRQSIMKLLEKESRLTVTEVYEQLQLSQSEASQHLGILRRANIVETIREGKAIYYLLNHNRMAEIWKCLAEVLT